MINGQNISVIYFKMVIITRGRHKGLKTWYPVPSGTPISELSPVPPGTSISELSPVVPGIPISETTPVPPGTVPVGYFGDFPIWVGTQVFTYEPRCDERALGRQTKYSYPFR